ncbi:hypothetical protein [uncultured Albimonas sp.]|uniref:hypothetical protein n=1 Tax=uncultured Albimonas sp. TaxID=1331701 RepID=UPI0030EB9CDF|tara:strand:- start:3974 stop:4519 length:546 start_codon:yes stop_codon:yes gene_type:complete
MSEYADKFVARALEQVPLVRADVLREWSARGRSKDIPELVEACERELLLRGLAEETPEVLAIYEDWAKMTEGRDLEETIFIAFGEAPPNQIDEVEAIRILHATPGIGLAEAEAQYEKGHFQVVMAHFVHIRRAFFRAFLPAKGGTKDRLMDVLILREKRGDGLHYTLRPETLSAWARLGVV